MGTLIKQGDFVQYTGNSNTLPKGAIVQYEEVRGLNMVSVLSLGDTIIVPAVDLASFTFEPGMYLSFLEDSSPCKKDEVVMFEKQDKNGFAKVIRENAGEVFVWPWYLKVVDKK